MKRFVSLLLALLCLCSIGISAMAAPVGGGTAGTTVFGNTSQSSTTQDTDTSSSPYGDITSPSEILGMNSENVVTTDDVNDWVDRKGSDLISIVTKVVEVAAFIGFLASLICIVVGAVGNKRTMVGGFIGLVIACLAFTMAVCAPQIINSTSAWLRS